MSSSLRDDSSILILKCSPPNMSGDLTAFVVSSIVVARHINANLDLQKAYDCDLKIDSQASSERNVQEKTAQVENHKDNSQGGRETYTRPDSYLKKFPNLTLTISFILSYPLPIAAAISLLPMFDVIMTTVCLQSTVLPYNGPDLVRHISAAWSHHSYNTICCWFSRTAWRLH